jgi:hypothetical protein
MKRYEYKFNGKVVAYVTEGLNGYAMFRTVLDGRFTRCYSHADAHAMAKAFLVQLQGVSPPPQ